MAVLRYAVLRFVNEWKVVSGQRRMGHFATRGLALNAGVRLAREALAAGHEVEFLVQDAFAALLAYDARRLAALLDERQGGTAAPADQGPEPAGVRALEF